MRTAIKPWSTKRIVFDGTNAERVLCTDGDEGVEIISCVNRQHMVLLRERTCVSGACNLTRRWKVIEIGVFEQAVQAIVVDRSIGRSPR